MKVYKSIDLFAGIGGIRLGFERAFGKQIETTFVSEWDVHAQKTYQENFKDRFHIAGDITQIDEKKIPKFDICLAGFPCQAFSLAGARMGFEDNYKGLCRGTLFLDVARICEEHKPAVIFCENVKGLAIHDKGRTLGIITQTFEDLGYVVYTNKNKAINSKDFGVPQNRERIYIVAFRKDIDASAFEFPKATDSTKTLQDIIEEKPVSVKYYLSTTYVDTLRAHKARHLEKGNGFGYEIRALDGIAGTIVCGGMGKERNLIIDNRLTDFTPVTHIKGEVNREGIRKLTPREWARLQGFPDDFKLIVADVHLYKQFGNSVTVNVIEEIAKNIKKVLDGAEKQHEKANTELAHPQGKRQYHVATGKNNGEWSEIYVFLKLLSEQKLFVADKDMNKMNHVFLQIISIIREEIRGEVYRYHTGDDVKITLNDTEVSPSLDKSVYLEYKNRLWDLIANSTETTFTDDDIVAFLRSIYINNIAAPAQKHADFFGGTEDITIDAMDYRTGISQMMGFSCKSDISSASTLFNANKDSTNFVFEVVGNITEDHMHAFNGLFNIKNKKGGPKKEVAIGKRMTYLKECGFDINFVDTATATAKQNLIRCGGHEMPKIVAGLLKSFYYENSASTALSTVDNAIRYLSDYDVAEYQFDDLFSTYHYKVGNLLYSMFTGLRFGRPWNGRSSVNGGYIVVKRDGDVVAFHSCIADEFKDFLIAKLRLESPSCTRHQYMDIYKENGKYYLKLALQLRFLLKHDT